MSSNSGFSGLDQMDALVRQLEQMGLSLTDDLVDEALEAGSEVVKEKIETHPNLPVSDLNHPHAKDNIKFKKVKDGQFDIGAVDKYFYLLFHEVGAQGGTYVGKDGKTYKTPNIPAKPFMRPAFESNKEEIERAMMEPIKRRFGL